MNNKGWPVTGADIRDTQANPRFVACDIPGVEDVRISRSSRFLHNHFNVQWDYRRGCVNDIEVDQFRVCWDTTIAGVRDDVCEYPGPDSTDARLSQPKVTPRSVKGLESIAIRPADIHYGGLLLGYLVQLDDDTVRLFEWLSDLLPFGVDLAGVFYPDQLFDLRYR